MQRLRTILFWCHLTVAVTVAAVVLVMALTGVLLTYERQMIVWWETRGIEVASPAPTARPLPLDSLVVRALGSSGAGRPGAPLVPASITWRSAAPLLVELTMGRNRVLYVDAHTGEVVGRSNARVRAIFAAVSSVHRVLSTGTSNPAARERGRAITGAANLGFLFLVASGFWLWWPRNWTREAFRSVIAFRRGLGGKAREFNWHHVIGIWSLVPLLVIVASGVVMSYPWANELVMRTAGERTSAPGGEGGTRTAAQNAAARRLPPGIDGLVAGATVKVPGWRSVTLAVPRSDTGAVTFAVDGGTGGQPQHRSTLTLDAATGAERSWEPFASQSPGRRARALLRFAHTGEVLGLAGQTIAGLASLSAVFMVWTGLSLSLRRFAGWRRRQGRLERQSA
jgi:uncharacterized iron-regulated membrane protein